jgi:phage shock protein E
MLLKRWEVTEMKKQIFVLLPVFLAVIFFSTLSLSWAIGETPQELFNKGTALYKSGDFRNSVIVFRSVIVMDPENKKFWRAYNDAYEADAATRFMSTLTGSYNAITYEELLERQKHNPELVLIDLRSAKDYAEEHIPKAVLIPLEELRLKTKELPDSKITEIVLYCAGGPRSATGQMYLSMLGYTNVKYLRGGVMAWHAALEAEAAKMKPETKKKSSGKTKK